MVCSNIFSKQPWLLVIYFSPYIRYTYQVVASVLGGSVQECWLWLTIPWVSVYYRISTLLMLPLTDFKLHLSFLRETKWLCGVWGNTPWVGCPAVPQDTEGRVLHRWLPTSRVWLHTPHNPLVFFLCHGFNHFCPVNILIWSFLWFWTSIPYCQKSITHGQKAYHMVMWYVKT